METLNYVFYGSILALILMLIMLQVPYKYEGFAGTSALADAIKAKVDADAKAKAAADAKAKAEADAKAKAAADAKAKAETTKVITATPAPAPVPVAVAPKPVPVITPAPAPVPVAVTPKPIPVMTPAPAPVPPASVTVALKPVPVTTPAPAPVPIATKAVTPTPTVSTPAPITPVAAPVVPSKLPAFMDPNRLLLPLSSDELFQYKLFHLTIVACAIKQSLNEKMKNKTISFKQIYRETLQRMGIEPRIFERNLDGYMNAIQLQSDRTWVEVFESVPFLNAITENINYFLQNPSQSKLGLNNVPNGTIQNIRKPIFNESLFVASYELCKIRANSLEFASPISFTSRLYD